MRDDCRVILPRLVGAFQLLLEYLVQSVPFKSVVVVVIVVLFGSVRHVSSIQIEEKHQNRNTLT